MSTLVEETIRPTHLMTDDRLLYAADVRRLMLSKSDFVMVDCPACNSNSCEQEFEKDGFAFVTCRDCLTLYINPRPTFEMLTDFYVNSQSVKYWNEKVFPASEGSRREGIFVPRAKRVAALCQKHGAGFESLLDVGAGFGTFCEEISKLHTFKNVIAVEPSPGLAETCRQKGLQVIEKTIEGVQLDNVNVITNFELIEHLYCPRDFIMSCQSVLPAGGLLILTTPNVMGFDLVTLRERSDNVCGPSHLNYFHPRSLAELLGSCGFDIIEIATPGMLDAEIVRKMVLSGRYDISGIPFLRQVLIDNWTECGVAFQAFLASNNLSSHLWMVAKRQ
jgi:2-polyprenyl-3-methyl-5-hydroxy-6-metoxy-1,4-benzoquinol methylase